MIKLPPTVFLKCMRSIVTGKWVVNVNVYSYKNSNFVLEKCFGAKFEFLYVQYYFAKSIMISLLRAINLLMASGERG